MRGAVPRTHAAARARQRASRPIARAARLLAVLGVGYVSFTACAYSDYPIEATFCDEWCRVLRRTGCEQEPENCIRDCEGSLPSERCRDLQATLLECYQNTPADRFACVGQGFQSTVRPLPEICTEQRHALIRCEVPRVMACVDACVALDASSASAAAEAADAGAGRLTPWCPEPPFPCERLCWELDARRAAGVAGPGSEGELAALGEPLIRCALARAAECRANAAGAASAAPMASVSWTGLFLACAGLPADLGALD